MVVAVAAALCGPAVAAPAIASVAPSTSSPMSGAIVGWGTNFAGQLGDGTTTERHLPTPVGLPGGVVQLALGRTHSLAVRTDATVWSWGRNDNGELGDGTQMERPSPAQVPGLTGVVQVAAGYSHSVALKKDGTVWTWGSNFLGQLGTGAESPARRLLPGRVQSLSGVVQVVAGPGHTLALRSDGAVWGWGDNYYGQLGDGTEDIDRYAPVQAVHLPPVTQLATSIGHSLAVAADKRVFAWGYNNGHLGDGTTSHRRSPVPVLGLSQVKQVAAGSNHSAALRENGTVYTWGANVAGQLGDPTLDPSLVRLVPGLVPGLTGVTTLVAGGRQNLALRSRELWGWGFNGAGPLYEAGTPVPRQPTLVPHVKGAIAVAAGDFFTMVVVTTQKDFTVTLSPSYALIKAGQSTTTRISNIPINGFHQPPVHLTVSGLPFGVTASLSTSTLSDGASATLTLQSNPLALSGNYKLTITAATKSVIYTLAVVEGGELGCTNTNNTDTAIPDNAAAVTSPIQLIGCDMATAPTAAVAEVHIIHPRRGDLVIDLIGPNGVAHRLRGSDPTDTGTDLHEAFYVDLSGTAAALTAAPPGQWGLRVQDVAAGNAGIIDSWTLTL